MIERRISSLENRILMMESFVNIRIRSLNNTNASLTLFDIDNLGYRITVINNKIETILEKLTTNFCNSNPCQNGGTCLNLLTTFVCYCPSEWDGDNCSDDVNECLNLFGTMLGCQNDAICQNTPGSYM